MSKNPAQRLQPVIAQAKKQEDQAAAKLAPIKQQLAQQQAALTALRRYLADYQDNWQQLALKSQTAQALQDYRRFLEQLQRAIDTQQNQIAQSQQQLQVAQNHWQQQQSRRQALHKLQSRYLNEAQQLENKREQRLLDELAQNGFGQHTKAFARH